MMIWWGHLQRYDDQFIIKRWVKVLVSTRSTFVVTESWRWYQGLRNTVENYIWKTSWGIQLRYTESWRWYLVEAARCMSARAMPYWRDIEKSCFILMAFLCIVNWPSAHIWGKGGRDATTHRPISSNSSGAPSSSSPCSALSSASSSPPSYHQRYHRHHYHHGVQNKSQQTKSQMMGFCPAHYHNHYHLSQFSLLFH